MGNPTLKRKSIQKAEELAVADTYTPDKPEWTRGLDDDDSVIPGRDEAREIASDWAKNRKVRQVLNTQLVDLGHDAMDILFKAYCRGSHIDGINFQIDKSDRRIASYEQRRYTVLRTIEQYNEKLASRVKAASLDILEGQFTEAAE